MTTLAAIEREAARRLGPYYILPMDRQQPSTATFDRAYFPGLRSSVEQDLVTNLWLLRRGVDIDNDVVEVLPQDRQRTVANYDPSQGMVEVDRPWSAPPASGEVCEFHHLDPTQELRSAVRAGLRRTRFADRFQLASGFVYEIDLTEVLPWLLNPADVHRVEVGMYYGFSPSDIPFTAFQQAGHVCLRLDTGGWGTYWPQVLLTIARNHFSFVNGADSTDGPLEDDDELAVDLNYAASAAHIEAWHQFPAKMQAAAAGNLQATQAMAALEYTRQALIWAPRAPGRYELSRSFGGLYAY